MSRNQQDQFIDDDEEETCPLCVEEFDLTDKGFKPCPCGYQICQFCYHNVKTNMNGLCPACRRPYNDQDIEYRAITAEDSAAHKARQAQKQKKTQAALQKEKQKAEADHLSRKHLAGLRVVQKNLVYVTGLSPTSQEEQLLQTLRGDQYFGQYGEIVKIVVSKAKDPSHPQSVGVYVTYRRKEDAANCIAAVDSARNGERTLRAQYGTTKYCSAYLRGENCQNRSCMFLHEPGEASDSYSRADLSALNAGGSQHGSTRPPPPQSQQPVASASQSSQPMLRQASDQPQDPIPERPALPSHASWASRPAPQSSRAANRAVSAMPESPAVVHATPATIPEPVHEEPIPIAPQPEPAVLEPPPPRQSKSRDPFYSLLADFNPNDLRFAFSDSSLSQADIDIINNYPPLFDTNGGAKRRQRRQREEEQLRMEQEARAFQQPPATDLDDNAESIGALQLGGDLEGQQHGAGTLSSQEPTGLLDPRFQFGSASSPSADQGSVASQSQLLQTAKTADGQVSAGQSASLQHQQSNPPGHLRNASRYSFANEASASTSVKPVASAKLLNQQSSIMPQAGSSQFGGQHPPQGSQFYTSNVQGPPPGLKATGTPPVSGGMTFGQGHGFATGGLQYGANTAGRNANEEMMRSLLRGRESSIAGSADAAKHDADFPALGSRPSHTRSRQHSISLEETLSRRSTPPVPPGFEAQAASESRRSTPTIPPGLSRPTALPADLEGGSASRPSSRASLRRTGSQVMPAVPLHPTTPSKQGTPTLAKAELKAVVEHETPTRAPRAPLAQPEKSAKAENNEPARLGAARIEAPAAILPNLAEPPAQHPVGAKEGMAKPDAEASADLRQQTAAAQPTLAAAEGSDAAATSQTSSDVVVPRTPDPIKKDSQRRKPPGKLDITAAILKDDPFPSSSAAASGTPGKATPSAQQTPAAISKPDSPWGVASSPAVKSAPRTLRVLPTPKVETPPAIAGAAPSTPVPAIKSQANRQPSLISSQPPGTPTSEQVSISDNMSVASTSLSRANSPPPSGSKVGSAPVRTKTKSQLKKERQERAKVIEDEKVKAAQVDDPKASDEAPAQEAIVSRKKKAKKEKEPKAKHKATNAIATADSTPVVSRASTPGVGAAPEPDKTASQVKEIEKVEAPVPRQASPTPPPPVLAPPPREPTPPPTPALVAVTAAQILSEIKSGSPDITKCVESFLRSASSGHLKSHPPITADDLQNISTWKTESGVNLTKDEINGLLRGGIPAVKYGGKGGRTWSRGMVTQTGAHLRALTAELEERYLDLERQLVDMPDMLHFRPTKPQNDTRFPAIDLAALKRQLDGSPGARGVSVMEQMIQDGATTKKGAFLVDEASKYLNEFVMPPVTPPLPPPPATGIGADSQGSASGGAQSGMAGVSTDIAERALHEARRVAEERDMALRKIIKKNRKVLGLG